MHGLASESGPRELASRRCSRYTPVMPQVAALKPSTIFAPAQWRQLTDISRWRGFGLIVHAWAVVAIVAGAAAWLWQWHVVAGILATPIALAILGGRQLGLAILMHDGAHGLLHPNRRINNWLGEWLTGAAVGSDLKSYRTYHLTHHRFTQQVEDPDLGLSAPFPTTRASLRRKVMRDLTGRTFLKQRRLQMLLALRGLRAMLARESAAERADKRGIAAGTTFNHGGSAGLSAPMDGDGGAAIAVAKAVGRFLLMQALLLTLALLTVGWIAYALWLAALMTAFQANLRIRNIAEHACTATGPGDPFSHARTTRVGWIERATVAPYWVNYHIEHHLFMGVPCYRLSAAHRALITGGYADRMMIAPSYAAVLRTVTASPPV
jgi:fatty acid desaturase